MLIRLFLILVIVSTPFYLAYGSPTNTGGGGSTISFTSPINCNDPQSCLDSIFSAAIKIFTPILGLTVMWAGALIMTARGNETQLKKGQRALWWSILGFVVILVATMIGGVVKDIIGP